MVVLKYMYTEQLDMRIILKLLIQAYTQSPACKNTVLLCYSTLTLNNAVESDSDYS